MDGRRLPADAVVRLGEEAIWLSKAIPVAPAPRSHHTRCHRRPIRTARSRTCRSSLLLHWTSCLGGGSRATGGGQGGTSRKRRFFPTWLGVTLRSAGPMIRQTYNKDLRLSTAAPRNAAEPRRPEIVVLRARGALRDDASVQRRGMPSPMKIGTTVMTNSSIAASSRKDQMISPPPIIQTFLPAAEAVGEGTDGLVGEVDAGIHDDFSLWHDTRITSSRPRVRGSCLSTRRCQRSSCQAFSKMRPLRPNLPGARQ